MLFHAGAFVRLNELGLLSRAKRISSVSGGSIAAGHLALSWKALGNAGTDGVFANFKKLIVDPILAFSRQKIDVVDALTGLLPWTSAAEQVAESYEKYLFGDKTLQDTPSTPRFVFCATNLQTGVLWRFSKSTPAIMLLAALASPPSGYRRPLPPLLHFLPCFRHCC